MMRSSNAGAVLCEPSPWQSRRLWSLWDMINFNLTAFCTALDILRSDLAVCYAASQDKGISPVVPDAQKAQLKNHFEFIERQCAEMLLERADSRLMRIAPLFGRDFTYAEMGTELQVLLETIEDDLKLERFFHYRRDKAMLYLRVAGDWAPTIKAFPSAKEEIEAAVDCHALGYHTACIFHLMRTAEYGLRALARERKVKISKKPIEWATWQTILEQVESSVRALGKATGPGPTKDAALSFYNGALAHYHGFKDKYRNAVMHLRVSYDEANAFSAITGVREFMNGLSAKIGETTKSPIRKWP